MISVENISITFGAFELFSNVSFVINPKDRIGLVGKNGAGKTTLLMVLSGKEKPNSGNIIYQKSETIGYLPQQMKFNSHKSVWDEVQEAFAQLLSLEKAIYQLNKTLSERTDYESADYLKFMEELSDNTEQYHMLGGTNRDAESEKVLLGLGFQTKDFHRSCNQFSGGWRMRIELAKILLNQPNLLLLDEPTNHLDIESIMWLEEYLLSFQGSVLMVSHDKAFLDNISNRTIELSMGKIYDYKLPYSKFIEQRKEQRKQQMATFNNQQKMIEKTEEFIERFRYKATKAVQVQSKIKQLNKLERIEVEEEDLSHINIKFPDCPHSGKMVIEAKNISKQYGDHTVLKDLTFVFTKGEKIAFVGKNGEGKTTLSRIIVGDLDYTGYLKIGHQVKIGYFAQNQDEILDENKTVLQTLDDIAIGDIRTKLRDILGAFLFTGDDIDKKVKVLSGGERSRLAIAKLLLEPVNVLVLDEPTNHLDIHSKAILKQALKKYNGSLIIVSHDRDFLHGLTEKLFEFKNHTMKEFSGDVFDFLHQKKMIHLNELNVGKKDNQKTVTTNTSTNKQLYEQRKELEKDIRKYKNNIVKIEKDIESLEAKQTKLTTLMSQPENAENHEIFKTFNAVKRKLDDDLIKWEKLHKTLEKLEQKKNEKQ